MAASDTPQHTLHALYHDHHGWLHGWLRRKLGCTHQAADLAQDTFVRIMASPHRLNNLNEPRAWLTAVAKHVMLDHWRRQEIERAYLQALAQRPEDQAPSPEETLIILEALHEIDAVLHTLPARVRQAFLMSQLDGLTYADIARRMSCSEVSIKRYMRQAFMACMRLAP